MVPFGFLVEIHDEPLAKPTDDDLRIHIAEVVQSDPDDPNSPMDPVILVYGHIQGKEVRMWHEGLAIYITRRLVVLKKPLVQGKNYYVRITMKDTVQ